MEIIQKICFNELLISTSIYLSMISGEKSNGFLQWLPCNWEVEIRDTWIGKEENYIN